MCRDGCLREVGLEMGGRGVAGEEKVPPPSWPKPFTSLGCSTACKLFLADPRAQVNQEDSPSGPGDQRFLQDGFRFRKALDF